MDISYIIHLRCFFSNFNNNIYAKIQRNIQKNLHNHIVYYNDIWEFCFFIDNINSVPIDLNNTN